MATSTFTVTATELKNNTCDILNRVMYGNLTACIERHGKVVAHIVPKPIKQTKASQKNADTKK